MTTIKKTSFEELGWGFYYDEQGKYPIESNEALQAFPGDTLDIYYRSRPVQSSDGNFYGNVIQSNKNFPLFFAGLYSKKDKINSFNFFGREDDGYKSLNGRIESVSIWDKAIDESSVLDYATNRIKMIGDDATYRYQSIEEAKDDGLFMHYEFSDSPILARSFDYEYSAIKSRRFDIGEGKSINCSKMDRFGDFVFVDSAKFKSSFTINFRFFIEELKDFTLFYSEKIGHIWFDVVKSEIIVVLYPHIGNDESFFIQFEKIKIHKWYDVTVSLGDGVLKVYVDGEKLEEHATIIDIGGVYTMYLNHSNIESITKDDFCTSSTFTPDTRDNRYKLVRYSGDSFPSSIYFKYDRGGEELINMLSGLDRDFSVLVLSDTNSLRSSSTYEIDNTFGTHGKSFLFCGYNYQNLNFKIDQNVDNSINFSFYKSSYSGTYGAGDTNAYWTDALVPNGIVKFTIKFKNSILDSSEIFPAIFTLPGLPISTKKVDITDNSHRYVTDTNGMSSIDSDIIVSVYNYGYDHFYASAVPNNSKNTYVKTTYYGRTFILEKGKIGIHYKAIGYCYYNTVDNYDGSRNMPCRSATGHSFKTFPIKW